MNKLKSALHFKNTLFVYSLILSAVVFVGGALSSKQTNSLIPTFTFLPIAFYFLFSVLTKMHLINKNQFPFGNLISAVLTYYGFIITAIMVLTGFLSASNFSQTLSAILFLPISIYFVIKILPKKNKGLEIPQIIVLHKDRTKLTLKENIADEDIFEVQKPAPKRLDVNRRQFIKLIGAAGLTLFFFSIFTKKAHAAFFGSVPGPGTVAIKDTTGTQIDPAEKQPTDGYKITQLDDTSDSPNSYYGYLNKSGAWFIMKDDGSGNYRYTKGASDFTNATTGWPNRTALTYNYFDAIF